LLMPSNLSNSLEVAVFICGVLFGGISTGGLSAYLYTKKVRLRRKAFSHR
jgi:hypothetical protein